MKKQTLGVGVIGAGSISGIYLKNMTERFPQLDVICLAANHLDSAAARAAEYGVEACTVDALLADPRVELAVILTPVGTHYELIKRALLAGKHVYTEKTLTDDAEKAAELLALAEEKGLYLGAAPDTFLGAALQSARSAIDGGLIGRVTGFSIAANRDNRVLLSLFPITRQPGAGVLYDYGVYYLTALVSLLGPVDRVSGMTTHAYDAMVNTVPGSKDFGASLPAPNESRAAAVLRLESGVTGTMLIDADSHITDQAHFAIYGTDGILYLTDPNQFGGTVRFLPNVTDWNTPNQPVDLWNFSAYGDNCRGLGPAELADAILNGRSNRANKRLAYHVLDVLTAILHGGETGGFAPIASTCDRPAPMEPRDTFVRNIGHASLQGKDMDAMLDFYGEKLGMRRQFTLTVGDFAASLRAQYGGEIPAGQRAYLTALGDDADRPWIVYMKLADGQFLELFYDMGGNTRIIENRRDNVGFIKFNYEVEDAAALRDKLAAAGVKLVQDLHTTVDGSLEFAVLDPDGNEVQFTQYPENGPIPLTADPAHTSCSQVLYTTQAAFQVGDRANMLRFYTQGLGLRKAATLTVGDLRAALERQGAEPESLEPLAALAHRPWIDYIEVAPHQYIELFYDYGAPKKQDRDLNDAYGYRHLCLETADIERAYDAVIANGLTPDGPISQGADGAYQFWLTDPDGNRLELMEYAPGAKQFLAD